MRIFLLKNLCEDCVDAVIISKGDNTTSQEIQKCIDKMKEDKFCDWQWDDIVNSLPQDCEIYDKWQDLEYIIY